MFPFGSASDWVLRRLLKVFLKRNISNFIATEVDVQQLGIQLDKGSLELKECLLDTAHLNERLAHNINFEFESVLIGRICINLLPPAIIIEDTVITLRQRQSDSAPTETTAPPSISLSSFAALDLHDSAIGEGVKIISKTLKNLLGTIRIESKRLAAQLELTSGHVVTVNIDAALLANPSTGSDVAAEELLSESTRIFTFEGLMFEISSSSSSESSDDDDDGYDDNSKHNNNNTNDHTLPLRITSYQGCHGKIVFDWMHDGGDSDEDDDGDEHDDKHINSTLCIQAELCGLHMETSPWVFTPLLHLMDTFVSKKSGHSPSETKTPFSLHAPPNLDAESLVKALMLPDGEHILEEHFSSDDRNNTDDTPEEEVDEFFDAVSEIMSQSMFSTRSLVSSFMSDAKSMHASRFEEEEEEYANSVELELILPSCSLSLECPGVASEESSYIQVSCSGVGINVEANTMRNHFDVAFDSLQVAEHRPTSTSQRSERSLANCAAILASLPDNPMQQDVQEERSFKHTIAKLDNLRTDKWSSPRGMEVLAILELLQRNNSSAVRISSLSDGDRTSITIRSQEALLALDNRLIETITRVADAITEQLPHSNISQGVDKTTSPIEVSISSPVLSLIAFNSSMPPLSVVASAVETDRKAIRSFLRKDSKASDVQQLQPSLQFNRCGQQSIEIAFATINAFIVPSSSECDDEFPSEVKAIATGTNVRIALHESIDPSHLERFDRFKHALPSTKAGIPCRKINITGKVAFTLSHDLIPVLQAAFVSKDTTTSKDTSQPQLIAISFEDLSIALHAQTGSLAIDILGMEFSRLSSSKIAASVCSMNSLSVFDNFDQSIQVRCKPSAIVFNVAKIDIPDAPPLQQIEVLASGICLKGALPTEDDSIIQKILLWLPEREDSDATGSNMTELSVHASDCLIVHSPSREGDTLLSIAVCLEDINVVKDRSSAIHTTISNIGGYVSDHQNISLSDESFPAMLQQRNYSLIAIEQKVKIDISLFESDVGCWKQVRLATDDLRITLNKRSAMYVKLLLEQMKQRTSAKITIGDRNDDIDNETLEADISGAIEVEILSNSSEYEAIPRSSSHVATSSTTTIDHVDFYSSKAIVGADGAWFSNASLSEVFISEHVQITSGDEFVSSEHIPVSEFNFLLGKASIHFSDSLYITGLSRRIEGEARLVVDRVAYRKCRYENNNRKASLTLKNVSLRHNLDSDWSNSLVLPYKDTRLPAMDITLSAAPDADWLVTAKIAPVMAHLEQIMLLFMNEFFSVSNIDAWEDVDTDDHSAEDKEIDNDSILIQRCRIEGFPLRFSYIPWTVDAQALRSGSLMELVNCLPELRAKLELGDLLMRGPISMQTVFTRAAFCWLEDVKHQLPSFIPGAGSILSGADALRKTIAMMRQMLQK